MSFEQDWGIDLVSATEGLDQKLCVVDGGRIICCVGFQATFYFYGEGEEQRERLISAYERYISAVGADKLVWGEDPKRGGLRKLDGTDVGDVRAWSSRIALRKDFSFLYHGGVGIKDASAYTARALIGEPRRTPRLHYFSFSLPLAWVAAHAPGAVVELVVSVSSILRPEHGYAGLAVIPWVMEREQSAPMATVAAFVKRFRGLDLDFPYAQKNHLSYQKTIKGINWLTVLGDAMVERLQGQASLAAALGPDIPIHAYPGGMVIEAGPKPQFGDVNRAERMPYYQRVSLALKPIRTTNISQLLPLYGFHNAETAEWLARFDEEPA
jgi:hypothetical protein